MEAEPRRTPIRERFREQVRDDVKTIALEQLADGGAQAISLNAIAKELGVSGPALYRYFANRDELLSSLVVDAYSDLRDALARPVGAGERRAEERGAGENARIRRLARAYRVWAQEQPHRYELLFKPPLPGYDAHSTQISEAGRSLMGVVLGVIDGGSDATTSPLDSAEVLHARSTGAPNFQLAVRVWSRLHGFVSLELGGAYNAMSVDADALFDAEIDVLTDGGEL
ncbi:TetR/AcrR family transcriptional regulator [Brachybacterium sp. FME24]|uniref:TetR/AcrR family transcriptional regulator n=1 Tax=Brachybacterium sp. FME24 TaxID=2742605 RepID=UPI001866D4FA|nr:TetR/AcrR family transcriptional regulator [Brachybacterium sp. FME24]